MDENNNVTPNGVTPETTSAPSASTDYVIGGPSTPVVESTPVATPVPEVAPAPAVDPAPAAAPVPEVAPAPAVDPAPAAAPVPEVAPAPAGDPAPAATPVPEPASTVEPTPVAAPSTASIYEQANSAAINPTTDNKVEDTPIYTTTPANDPMASYSVPSATTYASTDSTTYSSTYNSSTQTTESTSMAIASLILGILGIVTGCCCCGNVIFSIPGIICSILQKPLSDGKKPGTATAGLITSIIGIVMAFLTVLAYVFLGVES